MARMDSAIQCQSTHKTYYTNRIFPITNKASKDRQRPVDLIHADFDEEKVEMYLNYNVKFTSEQ